MEKTLILYPAIGMMTLTLFIYVKSYLDFVKAKKSDAVKFSYFKTYRRKMFWKRKYKYFRRCF